MPVQSSPSKAEMQVTSIRFERELIERLKELSGTESYQALIREVLWEFVHEQDQSDVIERSHIRSIVSAIAYQDETCALTGRAIEEGDSMILGLLTDDRWVPICGDALDRPISF